MLFSRSFLPKNTGLFRQGEIRRGQLVKGRVHGAASGYHNDVPATVELFLVQAVNLPEPAADTIADMGFAQLLAAK